MIKPAHVDLSIDQTSNLKLARQANFLSLFTSGSTLICCVLPATLVAIGSAATLTSLIAQFPQLIWISENKTLIFGLAGVMLFIAGYLQLKARHAACSADANLAAICIKTRRNAWRVYWLSVTIFAIGVFFAFILPLFV